ncbi:NUDIX hydrolase [Oryzibacter oryziterrae]|uniref:NUDIX hydrolase n=1 Tax=Oryzibacter oryziterrae TaxID=2766474 RepID=UPI001F20519C|nr:NUDIX domain-containing protein [Oryzibacter oryziterrae]
MAKIARQKFQQVAALPFRRSEDGSIDVVLVTTRDSGRWILPKGWPIKGLKKCEAAETEAMEEAGLIGKVARKAFGQFTYRKQFPKGTEAVTVDVYPLEVVRQKSSWLEKGQREVQFFSVEEAADRVSDAGVGDLIRSFAESQQGRSTKKAPELDSDASKAFAGAALTADQFELVGR